MTDFDKEIDAGEFARVYRICREEGFEMQQAAEAAAPSALLGGLKRQRAEALGVKPKAGAPDLATLDLRRQVGWAVLRGWDVMSHAVERIRGAMNEMDPEAEGIDLLEFRVKQAEESLSNVEHIRQVFNDVNEAAVRTGLPQDGWSILDVESILERIGPAH